MTHIPADLTREEGEILAAMVRDPYGYPPEWVTPHELAGLIRRGYVTGQGARWVATAAGNTVGASVIHEWYGETL